VRIQECPVSRHQDVQRHRSKYQPRYMLKLN
jgi:hypothetical protein